MIETNDKYINFLLLIINISSLLKWEILEESGNYSFKSEEVGVVHKHYSI